MATITIRMEDSLKRNFEDVLDDIGLSLNAAVVVFAKAVTRKGKIPFQLEAGRPFAPEDEARILKAMDEARVGKGIVKTMEELEAMSAHANGD